MLNKVKLILTMIKIEHTVFALPFAFMGAFLAARGWPTSRQFFWILVAMVGIRSAAMAFNRLVDAKIDAANRRTRDREIPQGVLKKSEVWVFVVGSAAVFVLAAYELNRLCFILSPVALAITFFYSFTKRFTWLSHLFLGGAIGLAPIGGWVAVAGSFHPIAFLLGVAVLFWIAGFDIVYACQDYEFDCKHLLKSIPQRWGIARALRVSKLCHLITFALLVTVGSMAGLGPVYYMGLVLILAFLAVQHLIVSPEDLSRVNVSFFTMNGLISLVIFVATLCSL
ncbi:MAG: putative 4-hydroxybenzoate polyprenyltransferase [Deltaproteobacteria bacterium]|nr:putative 4-hydroxybenzoate polyprenyltransferase [Deltaproteobacteria bacterium]